MRYFCLLLSTVLAAQTSAPKAPTDVKPGSTNKSRNNNMRLSLKQLIAALLRRIRVRRPGLPICKSFWRTYVNRHNPNPPTPHNIRCKIPIHRRLI